MLRRDPHYKGLAYGSFWPPKLLGIFLAPLLTYRIQVPRAYIQDPGAESLHTGSRCRELSYRIQVLRQMPCYYSYMCVSEVPCGAILQRSRTGGMRLNTASCRGTARLPSHVSGCRVGLLVDGRQTLTIPREKFQIMAFDQNMSTLQSGHL